MKNKLIFLFTILTILSNHPPAHALKILILGDSLTEGYGVTQELAFPHLIQSKFHQLGKKDIQVIPSGISGSTSASGLSRLKWLLKSKPDVLILALGSNDGLRGFKISETEKNLSETIELAQKNKIKVILAGLKMPPNYGNTYTQDFEKIFPQLSKKYKIPLIPFLLKDVGGIPKLNQSDGIHPNEKGHEIIAETVFKILKDNI
ncbi:MAG TPA: arylesterase [Pseudobdellovibrionaceae bacterium]|nr:arylesterase [Pseudobdellovibrionaceae bacterium]